MQNENQGGSGEDREQEEYVSNLTSKLFWILVASTVAFGVAAIIFTR